MVAHITVPEGTGLTSLAWDHSPMVSPSENMCANLIGHKFFSEEGIPVAVGYQRPSTQQHGAGGGGHRGQT